MFINILTVGDKGRWPTSFQWSVETGQGETAINCSIQSSAPICAGTSQWGWWSTEMGCPERLWVVLLWRYSRSVWMPTCATWCRGPALAGGLDLMISAGPFQPLTIQWFCDLLRRSYDPLTVLWLYNKNSTSVWKLRDYQLDFQRKAFLQIHTCMRRQWNEGKPPAHST